MNSALPVNRRQFVSTLTLAGAALALHPALRLPAADAVEAKKFTLIAFSKPFQTLSFEDTADLVAEVGWDGIECPVRKGGQVLPEKVEDDLPRMVEALKKRQRRLVSLTTDVQDASNPLNQRVLRAASKLGLKHYRLGFFRYREDRSIPDQLNEIKAQLREVVALNQELGLCAGFQNHSGRDYVGAPVWDIYELIKDFDRQQIGVHFDIGHATIEGGNAWRTNARLMTPLFSAVYVKDFAWRKLGESWKSEWCPLGQGMISRSFIDTLKKSPFRGPISQHHEYPLGAGKAMITAMQKDLATLKSWLAD